MTVYAKLKEPAKDTMEYFACKEYNEIGGVKRMIKPMEVTKRLQYISACLTTNETKSLNIATRFEEATQKEVIDVLDELFERAHMAVSDTNSLCVSFEKSFICKYGDEVLSIIHYQDSQNRWAKSIAIGRKADEFNDCIFEGINVAERFMFKSQLDLAKAQLFLYMNDEDYYYE